MPFEKALVWRARRRLCRLAFQTVVGCRITQGHTAPAAFAQRLRLAMAVAVLDQLALSERKAVARAVLVGAVERFPIHRRAPRFSTKRARPGYASASSFARSSRKMRDTTNIVTELSFFFCVLGYSLTVQIVHKLNGLARVVSDVCNLISTDLVPMVTGTV